MSDPANMRVADADREGLEARLEARRARRREHDRRRRHRHELPR